MQDALLILVDVFDIILWVCPVGVVSTPETRAHYIFDLICTHEFFVCANVHLCSLMLSYAIIHCSGIGIN